MTNTLIVTGYDSPSFHQVDNAERFALEGFCLQFGGAIEWRDINSSDSAFPNPATTSQKGWADTSSYRSLDQLKAASAKNRFLLVYQAPETIFANAYRATGGRLPAVTAHLDDWAEANRVILNFLQGNREICALVHMAAPRQQPSDFSGICTSLIGQEASITYGDVRGTDPALEAQAPQLIEKFTVYQDLYGKMQLAASLPGSDLNHSGNLFTRGKYLASLAAESLLADGEGLERVEALEKQHQELKDELELSRLQIHQLHEELEYYFPKYDAIREVKERKAGLIDEDSPSAICRSTDFASASAIEVDGAYAENGYKDIHLNIEDLALSDGRYFDKLSCKLAVKSGMAALEFRSNEDGMLDAFSIWPEQMRDEYGSYLLFIPNPGEEELPAQQLLLEALNTEDRQLIFGAANVLADHFAAGRVRGLQNFSPEDVRDWRLVAIELAANADGLDPFITVGETLLREELISESYNHLWIECRNLQFDKRIYPSYTFKLVVVASEDNYNLSLEFRELDGKMPPLEAWPPESYDEYGRKLDVQLNVVSRNIRIAVVGQMTETDRAMISSLVQRLPTLTASMAASGQASKKGWDFWLSQVADFNQKPTTYQNEKMGLLHRAKARLSR